MIVVTPPAGRRRPGVTIPPRLSALFHRWAGIKMATPAGIEEQGLVTKKMIIGSFLASHESLPVWRRRGSKRK
ncbi:MAG: hypothetical protein GY820_35460 [Gammaproteobacteria bacterium]|nr:hypothetical protein [Gammaproteobacteria bacterium]